MFGSIAHRYDLLNHLLSFGTDYYWRWVAARELGGVLSRPGCRILDLCAGTGDLALVLKRRTPSEIVAADFCHPMLTIAREKFRRARLPISTTEADALALPFASESFDLVALAFGFRNLVHHETALSEIRRVLKPGGEIAILEFSQVRGALFGPLFRFYFRFLLPKLGSLISGVRGPYQYLRLVRRVEDLGEFLPALDLFIMPSVSEGLGSSVLHAMAHGLPVVASRVGGLPEAVVHEQTGWLVEPNSPEKLATAIGVAVRDRERLAVMGREGRRRAESLFGCEAMVRKTESLYHELVDGPEE